MNYESYANVKTNLYEGSFEFISTGIRGEILKRITFKPTEWPNIYNLAFGDVRSDDEIDDVNISNNGDRDKILATIVDAVDLYTRKYPERWIYFKGSTANRTRLYRIAVSIHLK